MLLALLLAACGESRSVNERATQADNSFDPASLSYKTIPSTDLPPDGTRSLFDHIVKENGSLPYPFEKLVALLANYDAEGRAPLTVLIPDGRSLLKAHASFQKPRVIVAADPRPLVGDAELGPQLRGRLFLGFVEDAAEIEVISYNEQAGRFEFQLVKDYRDGGSPRLVYAQRAICTTCHAGGTPIFPVRPWEETSGQPAISNAIAQHRKIAAADLANARYAGAPIVNTLSAPEAIDEMTEIANIIPSVQRAWIDGCEDDSVKGPQCRRQMLKLALRYLVQPSEFNSADPELQHLAALQSVPWPKNGIALANGDLLNRNPFTDKPSLSPWQWLLSWLPKGKQGSDESDDSQTDSKISDFDKLPPLRRELDPLTPRAPKEILKPGAPTAITGLARMFSDDDKRRLEARSDYDIARLQAAVDHSALDPLLGVMPFRRQAIMQALLIGLGERDPPQTSFISTAEMSAPIVESVKPIEISHGSVLKHYEHYCFGCHRGNPNAKLDFMNGASEAEVLAKIKETSAIREALDYERYLGTDKENKLMPPQNSWQRRELDEARAAGKDDIAKMLEAVPGLFDF